MVTPLTPNRQQIARAVGNDPEMIRAFEQLFRVVGVTTPTEIASMHGDVAAALDAPVRGVAGIVDRVNAALRGLSCDGLIFVCDKYDFPEAIGGVIALADGVTYWVIGDVDLAGDRIVGGVNSVIIGGSSENSRLLSSGLSGAALISSQYTLIMRNITLEAETILDLDGSGSGATAIDWFGVNFANSSDVGTINGYSNFVSSSMAFLNCSGLVFSGEIGTVSFRDTLFSNDGAGPSVLLDADCVITRRFRNVDCAHVVLAGGTGIQVDPAAVIPDESFILTNCNFSGAGAYLDGIDATSVYAFVKGCKGILNTINLASYYITGGATDTEFTAVDTPAKVLGATTAVSITQGFTATDNRATYDRGVSRYFKGFATASFTASANKDIAFYLAVNGAVVTETEVMMNSGPGGRADNLALQGVFQMDQGDYVEIWAENQSDDSSIVVENLNFIAEELA